MKAEKPDNFTNAFEGTVGSGYSIVMALYNVIWSFIGYSNANYVCISCLEPDPVWKQNVTKLTASTGFERNEEPSPHSEDCSTSSNLLSRHPLHARQCRLLRRRFQGRDAQLGQHRGRRLLPQYARQAGRESHVCLRGSICIRQCDVCHLLSGPKYVHPIHLERPILTMPLQSSKNWAVKASCHSPKSGLVTGPSVHQPRASSNTTSYQPSSCWLPLQAMPTTSSLSMIPA